MRIATINYATGQIKVENNGKIELIAPVDEGLLAIIDKNSQLYDKITVISEGGTQE